MKTPSDVTCRGIAPSESPSGAKPRYTVPTIHHVPTNAYIMDSAVIAQFLESTYPEPSVPLVSELGRKIEGETRAVVGPLYLSVITPREICILSPRSEEYFRRTREASLGHRLEELLNPNEEESWNAADGSMRSVGELMQTNKADGPFVLGAAPSYSDFLISGSLQCARVVDEEVFQKIVKYAGFRDIYEACAPYMQRQD